MESNDVVKALISFINRAEKNRKYAEGTAIGRRAAINLYAPQLNAEERNSLDLFYKNFETISQEVFLKNRDKMKDASLLTYQRRAKQTLDEFKQYGKDPSTMMSWVPNRRMRIIGKQKNTSRHSRMGVENKLALEDNLSNPNLSESERYEADFGNGRKALIITPTKVNALELKKLKAYLQYLEDTLTVEKKEEA